MTVSAEDNDHRLREGSSLTPYECCDSDGHFLMEMLDNPEADRFISLTAIERAVAGGMTREQAVELYGLREDAALPRKGSI